MDRLQGRAAVVTGGASGIGRAIVLELAAAGMDTVVADIEIDRADLVAEEARSGGSRSIAVAVDVSDPSSVEALADAAFEEFGTVHVLCNNAGVLVFSTFRDATVADWHWVYGVNVMGVIHGVSAFLPRMLDQDAPGHIVNTSSIAGLNVTGVYDTSKAAVLSLTDALAADLEGSAVAVSCLLPGSVGTQIIASERNRPPALGGPDRAPEPAGHWGADAATCAVRLREALFTGERYVFAGIPEGAFDPEPAARARFDALMAAIERGVVPKEA